MSNPIAKLDPIEQFMVDFLDKIIEENKDKQLPEFLQDQEFDARVYNSEDKVLDILNLIAARGVSSVTNATYTRQYEVLSALDRLDGRMDGKVNRKGVVAYFQGDGQGDIKSAEGISSKLTSWGSIIDAVIPLPDSSPVAGSVDSESAFALAPLVRALRIYIKGGLNEDVGGYCAIFGSSDDAYGIDEKAVEACKDNFATPESSRSYAIEKMKVLLGVDTMTKE